jgi:hypothetical protein
MINIRRDIPSLLPAFTFRERAALLRFFKTIMGHETMRDLAPALSPLYKKLQALNAAQR